MAHAIASAQQSQDTRFATVLMLTHRSEAVGSGSLSLAMSSCSSLAQIGDKETRVEKHETGDMRQET